MPTSSTDLISDVEQSPSAAQAPTVSRKRQPSKSSTSAKKKREDITEIVELLRKTDEIAPFALSSNNIYNDLTAAGKIDVAHKFRHEIGKVNLKYEEHLLNFELGINDNGNSSQWLLLIILSIGVMNKVYWAFIHNWAAK